MTEREIERNILNKRTTITSYLSAIRRFSELTSQFNNAFLEQTNGSKANLAHRILEQLPDTVGEISLCDIIVQREDIDTNRDTEYLSWTERDIVEYADELLRQDQID